MDPEAIKKLRLDRRLQTRRGWIDPADLEKELSALPDVSDKIDDSVDEQEDAASERSEA